MPYLFIDTSARRLALYKEGKIAWNNLSADRQRYSEKIKEMLNTASLKANELNGVVVMQGKGSFSDTRAGVVVANMLLEFAGVPVAAIPTSSEEGVWSEAIRKLSEKPLEPDYYAEPNITKAKK